MSKSAKVKWKEIVQRCVAHLYTAFLEKIKERIRNTQVKAALAPNAELIFHHREIESGLHG